MKTVKCDCINTAKSELDSYVNSNWHDYPAFVEEHRRRWLRATPADSYGNDEYRVELWTLEGSPVKQICIVNHWNREIVVFNSSMKPCIRYTWPGPLDA